MRTSVAAFAAMFFCVAAVAADAQGTAPIDAYGELPTLSDISITPDGKTFVYVRGNETKRFIVIHQVGQPKPVSLIDIGEAKLREVEWVDNTHLLIITSMTTLPAGLIGRREEYSVAQWYDLATKATHQLFENGGANIANAQVMNVVTGTPQSRIIDGHTIVFVRGIYFPGEQGRFALFRFDLTDHHVSIASRLGDEHAEDWVIDDAGNVVAETNYYEDEQRWTLRLFTEGGHIDAIDVPAPIDGPSVQGLNEDGTAVVVRLPRNEGGPIYEQIALKDGTIGPWRPELHLGGLWYETRTGRVVGGPRNTDKNDYVFFDPRSDVVWRSIKAAFKDATNVDLVSWSDDHSKVVVRVFGPTYGDTYFYVDMATHNATPLGPAYDGVRDVSQVKWIDYMAADGRDIHAYLTLPMNRDPKNLPLVVLPHGGPFARDEPGFDWISQAIASRGYVVLQPEFRGSEGFGKDLLWAGFGEFGKKMQTDLSDGVRALAAEGLIDPKRVCIVGGSYGGYAALAGATLDTGVYRCAVSIAGISDLSAMLSFDHWPHNSLDDRGERYWDRFLGVTEIDDPKLDAISPIKHIQNVTIPILLIHGRDDTVVPYRQSDDMADALKEAGKQVEFVTLDGEDHWLSKSDTRRQMLEATVRFLETNNPPN